MFYASPVVIGNIRVSSVVSSTWSGAPAAVTGRGGGGRSRSRTGGGDGSDGHANRSLEQDVEVRPPRSPAAVDAVRITVGCDGGIPRSISTISSGAARRKVNEAVILRRRRWDELENDGLMQRSRGIPREER